MYRLRDQRPAIVSIHAQEPQLIQVPRLAPGRLVAFRVLHHGDDCDEHRHSHDEGASSLPLHTQLHSSCCLECFLAAASPAHSSYATFTNTLSPLRSQYYRLNVNVSYVFTPRLCECPVAFS